MSLVRTHNFSISLDGFGTGVDLTMESPFGHAGHRLHEWMLATGFWAQMVGQPGGSQGIDHHYASAHGENVGAEIMGRGKFGPPAGGPWEGLGTDDEWRGWWGTNPPFHTPVFVLTHYPRPPLALDGGNIFHFIDATPAEALALAREAAGGRDIRIGGGPETVRAFLAADLIDVLHVVIVPIVLGRGVRLWDGLEGIESRFTTEVVASPSGVVHLTMTRR